MKLKEEKYSLNSFIGGWYIPEKVCDNIISYYEKSKFRHQKGVTSKNNENVVDTEIKDSTDIYLNAADSLFDPYNKYLQICLDNYLKKYPEINNLYAKFSSGLESYNIQKYLPKQGYKWLHCERASRHSSFRCLVFMTYLNDVENGGTYFKYQNLKTKAKKGLTLIWPTDFTHAHQGIICEETKYIVTGWYGFIK
jgi:hypothetical protein